VKITLKIILKKPANNSKRVSTTTGTFESAPVLDISHADMKRLWEAEQTLNLLVPGLRVHIDVSEGGA
jgi:hypothetical protein